MRRLKNHAEFVGVLRRHQRVSSADIVVHYALAPVDSGEEGVLHSSTHLSSDSVSADSVSTVATSADDIADDGHNHKIGLAVPNSVGHAVVRNKIKRRFRVLGRRYEELLPDGCKVILRAKPSAAHAEFSSLDGQVKQLFSRVYERAEHPRPHHRSGNHEMRSARR